MTSEYIKAFMADKTYDIRISKTGDGLTRNALMM